MAGEERREERNGNGGSCSPEGELGPLSWGFYLFLAGGNLRGGFQQNNIHPFSRCAPSGSWSPLIGHCQGWGSLVIAAGPGFSHRFCCFLGLELKYRCWGLDVMSREGPSVSAVIALSVCLATSVSLVCLSWLAGLSQSQDKWTKMDVIKWKSEPCSLFSFSSHFSIIF